MASVKKLKERLARTLKARKLDSALATIEALAAVEPNDPVWPKRAARLLRAADDVDARLLALRRALALQLDQSLVLDAIATCKEVLEIDADDGDAQDCLDRLYLHGGPDSVVFEAESHAEVARDNADKADRMLSEERDGPLDAMTLKRIVPGARSIRLGDAEPGDVSEIPVDPDPSSSGESVVDLRLEDWRPSSDLAELAAAQRVVLPEPTDLERSQTSESGRAVSLRAELANVPLFGDLDPASLHTLIRRVRVVHIEAGQILFREGDAANSLYVVVEGAVVPVAEGDRRRRLAVLERGDFFGEIGLLTKQPRNATIEGLVDTKLLAIDRRVLWDLIDKKPSVATSILRFLRARLIDRQIRTNPFFAAFAYAEREAVARQFRVLEVADGARIVEQGRPSEGLFVVLSGSLELFSQDQKKIVGELGLGYVLGGMSLLEGQPSSVDVIAKGKCWLVILGESRFRRIVEANPRLVRVLRRMEKPTLDRAERPEQVMT